ncbi:MAG: hypothetical protein J0L80_02375 [Chitinophagales bacterium]|nr:hypothetical protein [Chitinophagales bacterium]
MEKKAKLSRLMKLSWAIQKAKCSTRAKALQSAWAIFSNEDITVFYLTKKLNHHKPVNEKTLNQMGLFTR